MTDQVGRLALGTLGAVAGFVLTGGNPFGAAIGLSLGFALGTIIFPGEGRTVEGQRLDNLDVAFSTYGKPIIILEGYNEIGANFVWSTPLKEHRVKQEIEAEKGGPPSTTVITFLYTVSMRTNFCEGPIGGILKFWADKVLIGDVTSAGSVGLLQTVNVVELNGEIVSVGNPGLRIFLGTEDQLAGPAETADKGIDSTPAYRGQGGAEWEDFLTTAYGNRVPSISALVTMEAGDPFPFKIVDHSGPITQAVRYTAEPTIITNNDRIIDLTVQDVVDVVPHPPYKDLLDTDYLGRQWAYRQTSPIDFIRLIAFDPITGELLLEPDAGINDGGKTKLVKVGTFVALHGGRNGYVGVGFRGRLCHFDAFGQPLRDEFSDPDYKLSTYFTPPSGAYDTQGGSDWAFASESGNSWLAINGLSDGNAYLIEFDGLTAEPLQRQTLTSRSIQHMTYLPSRNAFILLDKQNSEIIRFDLDTLSIDGTVSATLISGDRNAAITDVIINGEMYIQESLTGNGGVYDVASDVMVRDRSFRPNDWINGTANWEGYAYDPENHAIIVTKTSQGDGLAWLYLDRKSVTGTTPQMVVERYSSKVGYLPGSDIDASALSTPVFPSYLMTQRITVRRGFESLFAAFDVRAIESDWLVKFILGGGAPSFTITEDDIGATAGIEPTSEPLEIQRMGSENLFETATIEYIDPDFDFQTVTQPAKRNREAIDVEGSLDFAFPGGLFKDQAAQIIERMLFRAWNARLKFKTPVNWSYLLVDPGDVGTIDYEGQTYQVEVYKVDLGANGVIELEMVSDDAEIHTSIATGGEALGHGPEVIVAVGTTTLFPLDIVLLNDLDNYLGKYFAAGSPSPTWPGNTIFRGTSADALTAYAAYPSDKEAIFGRANTVLSDADPDVWDRVSTLNVRWINGSMSSVTEAAALDGANAVLVGSEVINVVNVTLNADGSETWDTFLRGSAGSEWAASAHVVLERVVLLRIGGLIRQEMGVSDLNKTFFYAPKTLGRDTLGTIKEVTTQFVSAKPRAPAHVNGVRSGNDWNLSAVRRTRLSGEWLNLTDIVPLGEASESYEWDIPIVGGSRVLTAVAPSITYTEAQQITDFGSVQDELTWTMYQMSVDVGRGFGTTKTAVGA
jgi:hypothetical protein